MRALEELKGDNNNNRYKYKNKKIWEYLFYEVTGNTMLGRIKQYNKNHSDKITRDAISKGLEKFLPYIKKYDVKAYQKIKTNKQIMAYFTIKRTAFDMIWNSFIN